MAKKKTNLSQLDNPAKYLIYILVSPLLLFKFIGDFIFKILTIFLNLFRSTYKIIYQAAKDSFTKIKLKTNAVRVRPSNYNPPSHKADKKTFYIYKRTPLNIAPFVKKNIRSFKMQIADSFSFLTYFRSYEFLFSLKLIVLKAKFFILGALFISLIFSFYEINNFMKSLPNPSLITLRDIAATTKIFDRKGNFLYEIYSDVNRTPVKITELPKVVIDATIAVEDKDFYNHQGISIRGIIRAIINNYLNDDNLQGGSTITQQLIRSALLTPEKTFIRKSKEIFLAIWTEQLYSKDQILEMYLNQVPYGGTAWGIEAASQTYFGKSSKEVNLSEAAILAGLPAAPSVYSPFGTNPNLTKERQKEVLEKMVEYGYISRIQADDALNYSLKLKTPRTAIQAPHFVMYLKELLEKKFGTRLVETGGLRVTTSLDLSLQEMAQKTVSQSVFDLKKLNINNAGVLITNPQNGEILAMVGSNDYFDMENDGNVNITLSTRPPGSSIKVVTYATALSAGFTASTILDDSPVVYKYPEQLSYIPVNYDGKFHGRVPLRRALASSYNVPAVKVLDKIGVKTMIDQAQKMGITSWKNYQDYGLSITLGGAGVTMLEMAKVYGTLANSGIRQDLNPFLKITDYKGNILPLPAENEGIRAVSPEVAFILSDILSDNNARTPAFGPKSSLVIPGRTVAVKTGTSDNKRDNWTIGYTPDFVVTSWVGNNDNSPMNPSLTSGVTGAAPIWNEIMTKLLADKQDKPFQPPEGIIGMPCYNRIEYYIENTQPKGGCPKIIQPSPTPTKSA